MRKSKENLKIVIIIAIFSIFLLVLLIVYTKHISSQPAYATNLTNNSKKPIIKISNAKIINIENIIENNNKNNTVKEEIYEKQEELEYITKYKNSNELYIGTTRVSQEGRNGIQTITMKKIYDNEGNLIKEEQIGARVTKSSLDKIIEITPNNIINLNVKSPLNSKLPFLLSISILPSDVLMFESNWVFNEFVSIPILPFAFIISPFIVFEPLDNDIKILP